MPRHSRVRPRSRQPRTTENDHESCSPHHPRQRDQAALRLRYILQGWTYDPEALPAEALTAYVRAYQKPGAVHGAMSDYRAGKEDVAQDQEDAATKINCPTLALWGQDFESGGQMWDMEGICREMATNLRTVSIPQCGHQPHEETPEAVNAAIPRVPEGLEGVAVRNRATNDSGNHHIRGVSQQQGQGQSLAFVDQTVR